MHRVLLLCLSALLLLACKSDKKKPPTSSGSSLNSDKAKTAEAPAQPTAPAPSRDKGDFVLEFGKSENPELLASLQASKLFEDIVAALNDFVALPRDVRVLVGDCGEVNAFFDPNSYQVTMCLELVEEFGRLFDSAIDDVDEHMAAVLSATIFTFLHEVGHALVFTLDIPSTGKEEDAVDQLATLMLLDAYEEGGEGEMIALESAEAFLLQSDETRLADLAFWDSHSLDEQRFYNIACLVYGKSPERHGHLIDDELLPDERAAGCQEEYELAQRAWDKLLAPSLLQ